MNRSTMRSGPGSSWVSVDRAGRGAVRSSVNPAEGAARMSVSARTPVAATSAISTSASSGDESKGRASRAVTGAQTTASIARIMARRAAKPIVSPGASAAPRPAGRSADVSETRPNAKAAAAAMSSSVKPARASVSKAGSRTSSSEAPSTSATKPAPTTAGAKAARRLAASISALSAAAISWSVKPLAASASWLTPVAPSSAP